MSLFMQHSGVSCHLVKSNAPQFILDLGKNSLLHQLSIVRSYNLWSWQRLLTDSDFWRVSDNLKTFKIRKYNQYILT